jgi:iron complex outermembrane receptor protein
MQSKRAKLLLLALQLVCGLLYAQPPCESALTGRVVDENGSPLFGATVFLSPGNFGTITDNEGSFSFMKLCPGKYTVAIQYVGYHGMSMRIDVDGQTVRVFELQEDVTRLDEVVIEHHDPANTEHATNFTELTGRELAKTAGKTLGETLAHLAGVNTLQSGPGVFKPIVHGVHSQRVLILNHGIRQEGQQWGAEHAPEIDPLIASNIVVIKDASAIKYGSDALGGVIVINPPPLPETGKFDGTVSTVLQSNGRSGTLSGMLQGGLKDRDGWGWRVQGTVKRTGDFETPNYVLTNTGIQEANFSAATGYHSKNAGLDLFFSRFQSEIGILRGTAINSMDDLLSAMERDVPLYTRDFSYTIREPRQEVTHNLLKLDGHISGMNGEWRMQYGFQDNHRLEFDMRIGDLSKVPATNLRLKTHSVDVEWETHHSETRTLSFGANAMFQENRNVPGTQRIPFIPDFDNITAGAFATSSLFYDRWTIDAGLRYDHRTYSVRGFDFKNSLYRSSMDFGSVSGSLGVSREIARDDVARLSLSTAWRPPHVSELFSLGRHQSVAAIEYGLMLNESTNEVMDVDDVGVSPEQAFKAVASYEINRERFSLTVSPYANYIRNFVYLRPEGVTRTVSGVYPYFRYKQTDALFIGVDADASMTLNRHLTAKSGVSLLRARDVDNNSYFLFIPSNRYSIDLHYERPEVGALRSVYLETRGQYVQKQTFSPRVLTVREITQQEEDSDPFEEDRSIFDFTPAPDGYFLWNLAGGFSVDAGKVRYDFRLSVENLLNTRYREYTNRLRYYADEVGRNFAVSVKCNF